MRSAAEDLVYRDKEYALAYEYGTWALEWVDVVLGLKLAELFGFGIKRLQRFFDGSRVGVVGDVERYTSDGMRVKGRRGWQKADEAARLSEGIEVTVDALERELAGYGIDAGMLDMLDPPDPLEGAAFLWQKQKLLHAARRAWYDANGRRAIRLYIAYTLLWMRDEHGFGEVRLKRLYTAIVPEIRWFVDVFLQSKVERDNEMKRRLEAMQDRLAELGIEFIQHPEDDAVEVRSARDGTKSGGAVSVLGAGQGLDGYNKIMDEVKKAWRVR